MIFVIRVVANFPLKKNTLSVHAHASMHRKFVIKCYLSAVYFLHEAQNQQVVIIFVNSALMGPLITRQLPFNWACVPERKIEAINQEMPNNAETTAFGRLRGHAFTFAALVYGILYDCLVRLF